MRYALNRVAAASLVALIGCNSSQTAPGSSDTSATPVPEMVRTCESIRADIIGLATQRGVSIVKIYDPKAIKIEPKKVSCSGRAVVSSAQQTKLYYRNYMDEEGDWLLEYAEQPLEK